MIQTACQLSKTEELGPHESQPMCILTVLLIKCLFFVLKMIIVSCFIVLLWMDTLVTPGTDLTELTARRLIAYKQVD